MKRKMARPGSGVDLYKGVDGREVPIAGVEVKDRELVQAKVRLNHKAIVRGDPNPVGMRPFLPLLVHARAVVLHKTGGFAQTSIFTHGKTRDASSAVIRHQNIFSRFVQRNMARPTATAAYLVEQLKRAAAVIDSKRADGAALLSRKLIDLVHRVQIFPAGMHCHKRRISGLRRKPRRFELSRTSVKPVRINTLAALFCGVCADVNEVGLGSCRLPAPTGSPRDGL